MYGNFSGIIAWLYVTTSQRTEVLDDFSCLWLVATIAVLDPAEDMPWYF
jgi:hypothetical protein